MGARLQASAPPAMTMSACPSASRAQAWVMASSPAQHWLSSVQAATRSGSPALKAARRAGLPLAPRALPRMSASTAWAGTPARCSKWVMSGVVKSGTAQAASAPPTGATGVRAQPRMGQQGLTAMAARRRAAARPAPGPRPLAGLPYRFCRCAFAARPPASATSGAGF